MAAGEHEPSRSVWLVDGDDPTLVGEAVRALVDELVGEADRSLVVEDHRGDDVDLAAVVDSCRTPPFLSDRRVVVLREVGRWNTEEASPLLAYLDDPLETTSLVLAAGGGRPAPKLLAAVKAHGHLTHTAVSSREAAGWVRDRIRRSPVRLDAAAESLVEAHLGEDLSRLGAILDVLAAAHPDGARLTPDDVTPYLGEAGSVAPWDLTDAIDRGQAEVALTLLRRLLGAGERHPLVVLAILHRHVGSMVRLDSPSIATEADAAAAMGIAKGRSTFPAKKALTSARRMGAPAVAEAIGLVADAEVALKGKVDWPGDLVLEVLVARLCRLARQGGDPARAGGDPTGAPASRRGTTVSLDAADLALAGVAALGAGAVNALAGGGTLLSFPALVAIGVPSLPANVTNTVSLCPGYFSGTYAQRADLAPQMPKVTRLAVAGAAGGLIGSALLQVTPEHAFRSAVPWLILLSCLLLLSQDRVRGWVKARTEAKVAAAGGVGAGADAPAADEQHPGPVMLAAVFAAAVYGGFFGAGLGIMLLAILGLFSDDRLARVNAVKQALAFVINLCAAALFAATGHVRWELVPVMAVAALIGGNIGGRLSRVVNPTILRRVVVLFGIAVAVQFWVG